jgi:two-component system, NarL family, competent response regulator ComA
MRRERNQPAQKVTHKDRLFFAALCREAPQPCRFATRSRQQLSPTAPQGRFQAAGRGDQNISLRGLDPLQGARIEIGQLSQLLLRDVSRQSRAAQAGAKGFKLLMQGAGGWHAPSCRKVARDGTAQHAVPLVFSPPADTLTTMSPTRITFVVIDDHPSVAFYLRKLMPGKGADCVGAAGTGLEGLLLIEQQRPDMVMVDWHLPDMTGLEVKSRSLISARWVLLSGFAEPGIVHKALDMGFVGVISKTSSIAEQLEVLGRLVAGVSLALDSRSQTCLRNPPDTLEPQAAQMLRATVLGEPPKAVAKRLGVTVRTVQRTVKEVRAHYRLSSPADMVIFARQLRLIDPETERRLLS